MAKRGDDRGANAFMDTDVALGETINDDTASGPASGESWVARLPHDLTDLRPGAPLDHYFVLGELGAGGMGVVLAAYDPDLDRKVAIKVLRADRGGGSAGSPQGARLLREAQALAKLSHPNVITIFEVASKGDRVALVMEYIDGPTLTAWLGDGERDWREVVAMFAQAGQGLAAAHAAGFVHRDFKPDNVIIGDGRARVTDFGLVSTGAETIDDGARSGRASSSQPVAAFTYEGSLAGTVPYMAPEQLDQGAVDERADQFAFCVSLYEGLYGERPFPGTTVAELRAAIRDGGVRPPPAGTRVPGWVRQILLRGLSADPAARHPSMGALLEALDRDPNQRRRRVAGGAVAVGLVGLAVFGLTRSSGSARDPVCRGAEARLAGVWDDAMRERVQAAFMATTRPHAEETLGLVSAALDRRANAWVAAHVEVCKATHVRGEQSEKLLDLRMGCLDRRLGEMRALTVLFASDADGAVVDAAVTALSRLTPLSTCDDVAALLDATPLPDDPATRARVEDARAALDDVLALERAGRYQVGIDRARALVDDVEAIDYPPLRAEAVHVYATLMARAGDPELAEQTLYVALQAAADARDHVRVADAWIELIMLVGSRQGQHERGLSFRRAAEAAVAQAGNRPADRAALATAVGLVLDFQGKHAEAREQHERAIALQEEIYGPNHSRVALSLGNLANSLAEQGMYADARQRYERALAIQEATLGEHHPELAFTLNNLGNVVGYQGDNAAAIPYFERALAIWRPALAPNHPLVATCLNNLGTAYSELGRVDEARMYLQQSLDMLVAKFGSDHPAVAAVTGNLGELAADHGDYAEAMTLCKRSLAIYEATLGKGHPDTAYALTCLGRAHIGAGAPAAALPPLRKALALRETNPGDPADLAETQFALARALWVTKTDRRRAVELATASRAAYAAGGKDNRRELDAVDAALREWSK